MYKIIEEEVFRENDTLIDVFNNIYLYKVGYKNLEKLSNFVFEKYAFHYHKKYNWKPDDEVRKAMFESDKKQFKDSVYFAYKTLDDRFLGTIKVSKRTTQQFSIEKDFNINIDDFVKSQNFPVNTIWHLGRLAIASEILKTEYTVSSKELIERLLIHSLNYIAVDENNLMLAESDVLIHKIFDQLGVHMEIIGEQKEFLGSPTYPVMLKASAIRKWFETSINNKLQSN
ncbi:hypothetical protein [uncultured Tenacibaculum sp.]|uniref:hypothetical protein n=1 Tax=uncultured Tenacibaculum sp. TaxID=174713 RepID=UPI0026073A71|nr:hypothetical protein [uncultured Tenacibaculum sp.]